MSVKAGQVSPPWAKPVVRPLGADGSLQPALDGLLVKISATTHQVLQANHLVCSPGRSGGLVLMSPLSHSCVMHVAGDSAHPGHPCSVVLEQVGCTVLVHGGCQTPCPTGAAATVPLALQPGRRVTATGCRTGQSQWALSQHSLSGVGLLQRGPGLSCSEPREAMEESLLARGVGAPTTAPLCQPPVPPVPEPQGAMWLQAAGTVGTPQGCSWATVGAAATGRGYGSCTPGAPELCGLPGRHSGCSWYPSLGDPPACAAYDAGAGHGVCWDVGAHGPRRPRSRSDAHSGGPGTRSPSAMENPGVESPQPRSELPFPVMLQEGPRVLHPRNRGMAVSGLLSLR